MTRKSKNAKEASQPLPPIPGAVAQLPPPKRGMTVELMLDRPDVGSGLRLFVVLRCSRKAVTVYDYNQLHAIRLSMAEWAGQKRARLYCEAGLRKRLQASIDGRMAVFSCYHFQYSQANAKAAIKVLREARCT